MDLNQESEETANESHVKYLIPEFFMKSIALLPSVSRERNLFNKLKKARHP